MLATNNNLHTEASVSEAANSGFNYESHQIMDCTGLGPECKQVTGLGPGCKRTQAFSGTAKAKNLA